MIFYPNYSLFQKTMFGGVKRIDMENLQARISNCYATWGDFSVTNRELRLTGVRVYHVLI